MRPDRLCILPAVGSWECRSGASDPAPTVAPKILMVTGAGIPQSVSGSAFLAIRMHTGTMRACQVLLCCSAACSSGEWWRHASSSAYSVGAGHLGLSNTGRVTRTQRRRGRVLPATIETQAAEEVPAGGSHRSTRKLPSALSSQMPPIMPAVVSWQGQRQQLAAYRFQACKATLCFRVSLGFIAQPQKSVNTHLNRVHTPKLALAAYCTLNANTPQSICISITTSLLHEKAQPFEVRV